MTENINYVKTETARLSEKRYRVRNYLRRYNVLPPYGSNVTKEQQEILDRIQNNDFSFYEIFVKEKEAIRIANLNAQSYVYNNTPKIVNVPLTDEEIYLKKKREKIRKYLRNYSIFPPYGQPMTEEQQKIFDQIQNNDFSFYEDFVKSKQKKTYIGNTPKETTNEPKHVFFRLRMVQILPPTGSELSEIHKEIINDVQLNWKDKTKNYFILKYLYLSTPEGRILYRTYRNHQTQGFNFNLTIDDIKIPKYCPYLNIELSTDPKDYECPNYATADRIDSSKGYVKGNVQIISMKANKMKSIASQEQLLQFSTNALKLIENIK